MYYRRIDVRYILRISVMSRGDAERAARGQQSAQDAELASVLLHIRRHGHGPQRRNVRSYIQLHILRRVGCIPVHQSKWIEALVAIFFRLKRN